VIRASLDAGVKRIVLTSSVAAVRHGHTPKDEYTEADWTDGDDTSLSPYVRSKTIAERAAWGLVREAGAEEKLATVNPGAIIGPVLGEDRSYSLQAIERLLGGMPAMPKLGFSFVDVRDVADLHIRAMTDPAAGGERFLAVGPFLWFSEVASVLRKRLGPDAPKIPTRVAPNFAIRALAMFDPGLKPVVSDLGHSADYSNAKAREVLGWDPRPMDDTITECAESLIALGLV
jgi:nucleoside-diphosphate-sugar epimerase